MVVLSLCKPGSARVAARRPGVGWPLKRGVRRMFHVEHTALQARLGARYRAPAER